jgi:Domain of unknown function (DUF6268)
VTANTTSQNSFDSSTSKGKINEMVADITIPFKLKPKLALLTGINFEHFRTKLFSSDDPKNFSSVTLKSGFNIQFSEKWSGTLLLLPKIASDFVTIRKNDFQIGGIGFMKLKRHENLNYRFGAYFNSELFGPFFVPLLGMYYLSSNKKFETNIMIPLQLDLNYKLISFMNVGLNFNGQTRSYHLTDVHSDIHSTYLVRATNEFYVYLKFKITKNLSIQSKLGQSVGRSFRVFKENDKVNFGLPALFVNDHRTQLNTDFSNGKIFQLALLYRISTNKNE